MSRIEGALCLWVAAVCVYGVVGGADAAELLPADGAVTINQVDFRDGPDSRTAEITVDIHLANTAAGLSSGYVNVADGAGNWIVRNLPIWDAAAYDHPSITTNLDLGGADGVDVTGVSCTVDYSPDPVTRFTGGTSGAFGVGSVAYAVGGFEATVGGYLPPVDVDAIVFPPGPTTGVTQKHHRNVQAAHNQCAPMAVANSLQWLEDEKGIDVPHDHGIGLKGDATLVGQLDTTMDRTVTSRKLGQPLGAEEILEGKLEYVAANGLSDDLITKHQGMLGGGNVTAHGVTSHGQGAAISIDWIISELEDGEDVEMGFVYPGGGGHFVEITGAGYILGVPYITYLSDHIQSDLDTDSLVTPGIDETDTRGTDKVDFSLLDGMKLVNEKGTPSMAFVISQSIPEPAALALMAAGGAAILRRRRP